MKMFAIFFALLLAPQATLHAAETLDYAREEIQRFVPAEASKFEFRVNPDLPEFAFAIGRKAERVVLEGHGESELLPAAYTALEEMGCRFEVTGPVVPAHLDPDGISTERKVFTPDVQRRGVRQHINFNMDVSGYPIAEAKEYIRNLARLRYNHISFHSYPCHWTRDQYAHGALFGDFRRWMDAAHAKPDDLVAGGYFYGGEFLIPDHPLIRPKVRFNSKYFTAPEFESVIHTQPERGLKARDWLRELMQEAKRCGMTIQFSTELNAIDNQYNEALVGRILEDYPLIQMLELVSAEAGDFDSAADAPANATMAREIITGTNEAELQKKYSKQALGKKGENGSEKSPLCEQLRNYANNIRFIRHLQAQQWEQKHHVSLICGSYACRPDSIKLEMNLAEEYLTATTLLAIMPGHSSREVFSNIQESNIKPELFKRLLINDWIEFDGYMMLQQNTAQGLYDLANYIMGKTGGKSVPGFFCNHWRTAPNALSFRYLDELSFNSEIKPAVFYQQTAARFGIPDADAPAFAKAMNTLDELSDVRAIAGNIGFNLGWEIEPARRDIGSIWWWPRKNLEVARDRFAGVRDQLQTCRQSCVSPEGQAHLDALINGVNRSLEHLKGVLELKAISEKYYDPMAHKIRENLAPEDESFILQAANRADVHFQRYLSFLSSQLSDRGEEGMLVTYYWGPVVFGHNIRATYGKQGKFIEQNEEGDTVPQPYSVRDEKILGH